MAHLRIDRKALQAKLNIRKGSGVGRAIRKALLTKTPMKVSDRGLKVTEMNTYERIYNILIEQGDIPTSQAKGPFKPDPTLKVGPLRPGQTETGRRSGRASQETLRRAIQTGGSEMYRTRSLASQPKQALMKPRRKSQGVGLDIKA